MEDKLGRHHTVYFLQNLHTQIDIKRIIPQNSRETRSHTNCAHESRLLRTRGRNTSYGEDRFPYQMQEKSGRGRAAGARRRSRLKERSTAEGGWCDRRKRAIAMAEAARRGMGGGQVGGVFVGKLRNRVGLGFARPWPMGREHGLDADADKNFFYIFFIRFFKNK